MWLLNCSNYRLEPHDPDGSRWWRPYLILSHTWDDDEVTFQDIQDLTIASQRKGFQKVKAFCELSSSLRYNHVWVDTCCIDKTSSAELSEAINSMFHWYKKAAGCIAYLEDLEPGPGTATEGELRACRWFTRGWTLQELLAPNEVLFYDKAWKYRGDKRDLSGALCSITRIKERYLASYDLQTVPVATKMSWASGRQTTRIEDKAYCLLGIFNVHMPLLYGEGRQAFIRLQQTIAERTNDMSLFAWMARYEPSQPAVSGLLASDPSLFEWCPEVVPIRDPLLPTPSWVITNAGMEITTALDCPIGYKHNVMIESCNTLQVESNHDVSIHRLCYRLFLHCRIADENEDVSKGTRSLEVLAIWVRKTTSGFVRYKPTELISIKQSDMEFNDASPIRIAMTLTA
jgi:hypothetical protein